MTTHHHGTVCKTCRRRGKKCDKLLPECSTRVDKGIKCEGHVFRWSGVASRGKLAGKRIPVTDSTSGSQQKQTWRVEGSMECTSAYTSAGRTGTTILPISRNCDDETFWGQPAAIEDIDISNSFEFNLPFLEDPDIPQLEFDLSDLEANNALISFCRAFIFRGSFSTVHSTNPRPYQCSHRNQVHSQLL